jgi:hypothetical protein
VDDVTYDMVTTTPGPTGPAHAAADDAAALLARIAAGDRRALAGFYGCCARRSGP